MPKCLFPGCKSPTSRSKEVILFVIPQSDRKFWEEYILGHVLPVDARVCQLHYRDSDLIKGKTTVINGERVITSLKWVLRPEACPAFDSQGKYH